MPATPAFNQIPQNLVAPIFAFEVNSGGQYSAQTRLILIGHKIVPGTVVPGQALTGVMPLNTPTPCASLAQADQLAGPGSLLREMYRVAQQIAPAQPIWLMAVAEPATAVATWTATVAALPSPGAGEIEICGRRIPLAVSATDTIATVAAAIAAAVNAYYDGLTGAMLPVTASSAAGVVTLTARHPGAVMNDVDLYVSPRADNVLGASGVMSFATGTAGTGAPDISSALAALNDDPADFVVSPFGGTAALAAVTTAFGDASGRWAWNRMSYGAYWFPVSGNFSAIVTAGLALPNARQCVPVARYSNSPTPSWIWIAERAALESTWLSDIVSGNVSRNQTGRATIESRPPRDRSTWWNYNARNQIAAAGVSTSGVSPDGHITVDKTVTAYKVNAAGQPDSVFRDVQAVYQIGLGLPFIRAAVWQECGQKALMDANPGSLAAVVTPKDIKASFGHAVAQLEMRGVFDNSTKTIAQMVVARDAQNRARVNVYAPLERVSPLDILAVNATVYAQLPA